MDRRDFLKAGAAAAAFGSLPVLASPSPVKPPSPPKSGTMWVEGRYKTLTTHLGDYKIDVLNLDEDLRIGRQHVLRFRPIVYTGFKNACYDPLTVLTPDCEKTLWFREDLPVTNPHDFVTPHRLRLVLTGQYARHFNDWYSNTTVPLHFLSGIVPFRAMLSDQQEKGVQNFYQWLWLEQYTALLVNDRAYVEATFVVRNHSADSNEGLQYVFHPEKFPEDRGCRGYGLTVVGPCLPTFTGSNETRPS